MVFPRFVFTVGEPICDGCCCVPMVSVRVAIVRSFMVWRLRYAVVCGTGGGIRLS